MTVSGLAVLALWPFGSVAQSNTTQIQKTLSAVEEESVCRSLAHCLSLLDAHPQDSFDYSVLSDAFATYGKRGRKALLRRLKKGGAPADHAADLLALSRDESLLSDLDDIIGDTTAKTAALATRTRDAIKKRIEASIVMSASSATPVPPLADQPPCTIGMAINPAAQRREMPFFEADIARPDRYGAYRPSPEQRVPIVKSERRHLRSAVSYIDGWIGGYAGGLVAYDGHSGAPTALTDMGVVSVQRRRSAQLDGGVWAILEARDGLLIVDALEMTVSAQIPGYLTGLRRTKEDRLMISTSKGVTISVTPEGVLMPGCETVDP